MKQNIRHITEMPLLINFIIIGILIFFSQCKEGYRIELMEKAGTIEGEIENYDGESKSGKLTYFDGIGRIIKNEIFAIDSTGKFIVLFDVPSPIYDAAYLDLNGKMYFPFLEPGKKLKVKIKNNSIEYLGESGISNIQIKQVNDTLYKKLKNEIDHCRMLHTTDIEYKDYLQQQINLSNKKIAFINEYEKTNFINPCVINAIKKEALYSAAHSWITFRFDYSNGRPQERDTLFNNFYEDLFIAYPINDIDAVVSRKYMDYISNIKDVLSESKSIGTRIEFIKKSGMFSDNELKLIQGLYNQDTTIRNSEEYLQFRNSDSFTKWIDLGNKYLFHCVLNSCKNLPKGIGRDLVISQAMCDFYFTYSYIQPTKDEWDQAKDLIDSEFVLEYLLNIDNSYKAKSSKKIGSPEIPESVRVSAQNLNDKIVGKYLGKVVYVDFYATWCSPCKDEVPYSKMLIEKFKNEDVVFLFLCCQSSKKSWEKLVEHDNLNGEHYFVSNSEYTQLSIFYEVNGFPTYVLIDKKGNIVSKQASRPSMGEVVAKEIEKLL